MQGLETFHKTALCESALCEFTLCKETLYLLFSSCAFCTVNMNRECNATATKDTSASIFTANLRNYFNLLSVCFPYGIRHLSVSVHSVLSIPAVGSLAVTNKSCLACVKSEKYAFLVTLTEGPSDP